MSGHAAASQTVWRRYGTYTRSGAKWFDVAPSQWQVKRVRHLFRLVNGATPASGESSLWDGSLAWFTPDDLSGGEVRRLKQSKRSISDAGYRSCGVSKSPPGSLILSTRAPIGYVALTETESCTNQGCRTLVPRGNSRPEYYFYALMAARSEMAARGNGTTFQELSSGQLGDVSLPHPSMAEQDLIAAFLDRETARLDGLIQKRQRMIALLQEKRASLITRAVTRGLNLEAPLKDSGVEWLGRIPAHWEVKRLKFSFTFLNSRRIPLSSEERADMERTYDYYGASGVIDKVDAFLFDEPTILVAEDGANLLSRSTPLAFIATGKYWVNNHAHILRPLSGAFAFWEGLLTTFDFTPLVSGSAQPKLTKEALGKVLLPVPPANEQQDIARHIDEGNRAHLAAIEQAQRMLRYLAEYRASLITAAVTGQIDVRALAP